MTYKSSNVDVSVASPLFQDSNLRDLIVQTGNVKKTSLETGRTTGLRSRSTKLIVVNELSDQLYGQPRETFSNDTVCVFKLRNFESRYSGDAAEGVYVG
jgi:hypothetical protein